MIKNENLEILFHGSPNHFYEFNINKDFLNTRPENLVEGIGIYLTDNKEIAENYGKYLYHVIVNKKNILDFTKKETIKNIIKETEKEVKKTYKNFNFKKYIKNISELIENVVDGYLSISFYKEINNLLDSNEVFYIDFQEDVENIFEIIEKTIKKYTNNYIIKYKDNNLGYVYIYKNPEDVSQKLRILAIQYNEEQITI